jgi:clostripain
LRGSGDGPLAMNYMMPGEPGWNRMPYFDVYELAQRIHADTKLPEVVRARAADVAKAEDAVVGRSFGLAYYEGFESGKNGLFVVFPDGDAHDRFFGLAGRAWKRFAWYAPGDVTDRRSGTQRDAYGKYRFCGDGATPANGAIENWFELLDRWFDEPDDGGVNGYRD